MKTSRHERRLVLRTETLRRLSGSELARAAGGAWGDGDWVEGGGDLGFGGYGGYGSNIFDGFNFGKGSAPLAKYYQFNYLDWTKGADYAGWWNDGEW